MYVIPLFSTPLSPSIEQVWLFLERNATHLIETEDATAAAAFAADNDIALRGPPVVVGPYVFLPVDPAATALTDFYTWRELPPAATPLKEAWRPFLWSRDDAGLNRFLEEIILGDELKQTAHAVLGAATRILA